jgi:hypothetical protein
MVHNNYERMLEYLLVQYNGTIIICVVDRAVLQTIGIFSASTTSISSQHRHQLKVGQNTLNNIIVRND